MYYRGARALIWAARYVWCLEIAVRIHGVWINLGFRADGLRIHGFSDAGFIRFRIQGSG